MPIYDYTCSACGHPTEMIHGINEPGPTFCPACGAEGTMKRRFAPPVVHFKGTGWAKKDRKATSTPGTTSAPAKTSGAAVGEGATGGDGSAGAGSAAAKDGSSSGSSATPKAAAAGDD